MKKIFFVFLCYSFFTSQNFVTAQIRSIAETKKILCSNKWLLSGMEEEGKKIPIPDVGKGAYWIFKSNGSMISFAPAAEEPEQRATWSITEKKLSIVEVEFKDEQLYEYSLDGLSDIKLRLSFRDEDEVDFTIIFQQAEKIAQVTKSEGLSIGQQVWAFKNLDTEYFSNGDRIEEADTKEEWKQAAENGEPAWCYSMDDELNGRKFAKLYNWFAVNDPRGLAPDGWHVPNKDEVNVLVKFLGGPKAASAKMKTTDFWENNGGGTNSSGFSAMPAGKRFQNGAFTEFNFGGYFWTTTLNSYEGGNKYAHHFLMQAGEGTLMNGLMALLGSGCSVRCIKD